MLKKRLKSLKIILVLLLCSCATTGWDWQPEPYASDHKAGYIISAEGLTVPVDVPEFDDFVSFHIDNIESLMENIERLNISDKKKWQLLSVINTCLPENIKSTE